MLFLTTWRLYLQIRICQLVRFLIIFLGGGATLAIYHLPNLFICFEWNWSCLSSCDLLRHKVIEKCLDHKYYFIIIVIICDKWMKPNGVVVKALDCVVAGRELDFRLGSYSQPFIPSGSIKWLSLLGIRHRGPRIKLTTWLGRLLHSTTKPRG